MKLDLPKILVVDDTKANLVAMRTALSEVEAEIITAENGNEALSLLLRHKFAVILLDVQMPDMDGFETAELISQIEESRNTPIIFITAIDKNERDTFKGYASGAVDFLFKPIDPRILLSKVRIFLQIYCQNQEIIFSKDKLMQLLKKKNKLVQVIRAKNAEKDDLLKNIVNKNLKLKRYFATFLLLTGICSISFILLFFSISAAMRNKQLALHATELGELNRSYKRFVPSEFLQLLGKSSILDIEFGDQALKKMWVLFADVRDYTSITESLSPRENIELLNEIFSVLQPPIQEHGGIINKHLGDGLMALFPLHADEAVQAAVDVMTRLREFNELRLQKNLAAIRIGIGIDGGEVVLGTVGQKDRMETTVISDVVVSASRIEGITKIYGANILISKSCANALISPHNFSLRKIDQVILKGKAKTVTVLQVLNGENLATMQILKDQAVAFREAKILFKNKQFLEAEKIFSELYNKNNKDLASCIFAKRSKILLEEWHKGTLGPWPAPTNVLRLDPCHVGTI